MITLETLRQNNFKQGFLNELFVYDANHLIHIIKHHDDFVFRCYGRTVCIIKDEYHLKELIAQNKTREESFKNYPITKHCNHDK